VLAAAIAGGIAAFAGVQHLTPADDGRPVAVALSGDARVFASACERGNAVACNDLGVSFLKGYSVAPDSERAFQLFERACDGGSADACSNLGALYERDAAGSPLRLSKAAQLYEQACDGGAGLGCSNLGALYAHGKGVERDRNKARRLFMQACETGSAQGCSNLMRLPTG